MSQIGDAIEQHARLCKDENRVNFVSWRSVLIGFGLMVAAIIVSAVSTTNYIGDIKTDVKMSANKNAEQDARIERIEEMRSDVRWIRKALEK